MFEKFLSASSADFRQRYEGTYGFYTVEGQRKFLARLDCIDPERRVAYFVDSNEVSYNINADTAREIGFEFLPPESAFYNTSDGVFFMERVASRQFKRGACSSNMRAYLIGQRGFNQVEINFNSLIPVYQKVISYPKAAESLAKTGILALSPNLMLSPKGVFVFREMIGTYSGGTNEILVDQKGAMFITELKDALRACGLTNVGVSSK
jgi:hypothetical protein